MDSDLRELYQQVILDHHRHPRNFGELDSPDGRAEGFNPLCGDRVNVELKFGAEGRIEHVAFTGQGCAICTASASLMTECLTGKTREEGEALVEDFRELVTGTRDAAPGDAEERLGKLAIFAGVREFPVRVKCATLPWHTFHAALASESGRVSTE
ncbi:MAG: SUF system NifU family Fe-S cluster assembly protein [bacterium]